MKESINQNSGVISRFVQEQKVIWFISSVVDDRPNRPHKLVIDALIYLKVCVHINNQLA